MRSAPQNWTVGTTTDRASFVRLENNNKQVYRDKLQLAIPIGNQTEVMTLAGYVTHTSNSGSLVVV